MKTLKIDNFRLIFQNNTFLLNYLTAYNTKSTFTVKDSLALNHSFTVFILCSV